ncbi:MAG: hypothetical protein ABL973_08040 [Micropepsaceae bacterium]
MLRSAGAVLAGLVTIFVTHIGTDQIMHDTGVFPPLSQPMYDPALNLLALTYRCVFSIVGCYVTAALAPRAPFEHATALGIIGTLLSGLGVFVATQADLGPLWYPLALLVSALPCAWAGGWLYLHFHRSGQ